MPCRGWPAVSVTVPENEPNLWVITWRWGSVVVVPAVTLTLVMPTQPCWVLRMLS